MTVAVSDGTRIKLIMLFPSRHIVDSYVNKHILEDTKSMVWGGLLRRKGVCISKFQDSSLPAVKRV